MAKFRFTLGIGFVGAKHDEVIEIPDDELESRSEREREKVIDQWYEDWRANHLDGGWRQLGKD